MKHVKKINEEFDRDEIRFPKRKENGLRTKIDAAILYFLSNESGIDLDYMKENNLPLGGKEYQSVYKDIIEVLKKHKRY